MAVRLLRHSGCQTECNVVGRFQRQGAAGLGRREEIPGKFEENAREENEMKKFVLGLLSVLMVACFAPVALAQHQPKNPRATSTLTVKGKTVSVEYGQPSLKGQTIEQRLAALKPGQLWRIGADTSTTFKTGADLAFGDVTIPAGEYSIWMQQQEDKSWKLLFDQKHGQWGAPSPPASEAFASVPMKNTQAASSVDLVTITLAKAGKGGTITVQWGTLEASASFQAK
jgi:hypothetical protein